MHHVFSFTMICLRKRQYIIAKHVSFAMKDKQMLRVWVWVENSQRNLVGTIQLEVMNLFTFGVKWVKSRNKSLNKSLEDIRYFLDGIWKRQAITLREESSQTNVILQYKLLASIWSAVCSVIQQSYYVIVLLLHIIWWEIWL